MAYENWTTWTEVDAAGDLTVAANQITISTLTDDDACVYKNYGANYFSGQFTHYIDFQITDDSSGNCIDGLICYSDMLGATYADIATAGVLIIYGYNLSGSGTDALYIEYSSGYDGLNYNLLVNTTYFLKIVRDASGVVTVYVYSDSGHTTLLDSVAVTHATAYDYLSCAFEGYSSGNWSGSLYNLDIGAAAAANPVGRIIMAGNESVNRSAIW